MLVFKPIYEGDLCLGNIFNFFGDDKSQNCTSENSQNNPQ